MSGNDRSHHHETGYAKLNLALHVRNRLPNGYHELETIFAFVDKGDLISASPSDDLTLHISGPFADDLETEGNLVLTAAQQLKEKFDVTVGASLHLVKNLPIASGIGGGSADAAATLRLLNKFWNLNLSLSELETLAQPLGADVPACVTSETAIGLGIGQDLQPLKDPYFSEMYVVLANPLTAVSTKEIFERWDGVDLGPLHLDDMTKIFSDGRNDLQSIAMDIDNSIAPILKAMEKTEPLVARMSGSGATCFSMYEREEQAFAAEKMLQSSVGKIWTMTGQIR